MTQFFARKLNKKGFTLAELLIVVAIIAILVAVALPIFANSLESARIAVHQSNARAIKAMAITELLAPSKSHRVNIGKWVEELAGTGKVYALGTVDGETGTITVTGYAKTTEITMAAGVWAHVTKSDTADAATLGTASDDVKSVEEAGKIDVHQDLAYCVLIDQAEVASTINPPAT